MLKQTKTQVVAEIKKNGSWNGLICPSKMRPNGVWGMGMGIEFTKDDITDPLYPNSKEIPNLTQFDSTLNSFRYYNCTNETGKYIHFYKTV